MSPLIKRGGYIPEEPLNNPVPPSDRPPAETELRTVVTYKADGQTRTDESLLKYAVMSAGAGQTRRTFRWGHVKGLLGIGSTSAIEICIRFGIDPDEFVGGCADCKQSESRECACGHADGD